LPLWIKLANPSTICTTSGVVLLGFRVNMRRDQGLCV
jgi:hypothetical protein